MTKSEVVYALEVLVKLKEAYKGSRFEENIDLKVQDLINLL